MTVSELIEELMQSDPDSEVVIRVLNSDQSQLKVESIQSFKYHNEFIIYAED